MIRVGLVGCGNIGNVHSNILKDMKQVQIEAFVDTNLDCALKYKEMYGTKDTRCYKSLSEMLRKEKIDVLHICTPHYLHVPMAIEAFQEKIHVFMEKPPAISKEEFSALKKAKQESGKELGICFQNRYNEATEKASEILESKILGKIKGARAFITWNRQADYYESGSWRGRWDTEGGGVLINQAIHMLDLLTYFLGKPEYVEASMKNHHLKEVIEVEDTIEAYITFASGIACFYATSAFVEDSPILLELVCEKGKVRIEGNCLEVTEGIGAKQTYDFTRETKWGNKQYWGNSHQMCIQDFYHSLESENDYRNNLESVENTFYLTMDIYEQCKGNRKKVESRR